MEIMRYVLLRRRIVILVIAAFIYNGCSSQQDIMPDMQASFAAMIVSDIDTSINWYTGQLGFTVIDRKEYHDMGFKQSNLQKGPISIELIELESALLPSEAVPNYTNKTRMIGIFKIGFTISNFDISVERLNQSGVEFHGSIVKDERTGKKMVIIKDPDGNRIQLFEN